MFKFRKYRHVSIFFASSSLMLFFAVGFQLSVEATGKIPSQVSEVKSPLAVVSPSLPKTLLPAEDWIRVEAEIARQKLRTHLQMPGISRGAVIASPQKQDPNYFRHWVRDGALVMGSLIPFAKENKQAYWRQFLSDYISFSLENQGKTSNFGEPIFEVDGRVFAGPWGRPQNDGPALRALALIEWAEFAMASGDPALAADVDKFLYRAEIPAKTLIKADLEYVATHWQESSFDLWEEVKGDHFFTRMVQYKALLKGSELANKKKDPFAAVYYSNVAEKIRQSLEYHLTNSESIVPTLNFVEGVNYKASQIDIAVLLGVLRGSNAAFPLDRLAVKNTFFKIQNAFSKRYAVNQKFAYLAPALGRYPEDLYAGTDFDGGNPWVLATLAAAEYCYEMSILSFKKGDSNFWFKRGDDYIQRVQFHANPDGSLSEQIQRESGYMVSAADLSWNYAAVITTESARSRALVARKSAGFK